VRAAEVENIMKKTLIITVVLAMGALVSAANEFDLPPGKWWENPRLVDHISLSDEQQVQIRQIVYAYAKRMIDLKADVDKAGVDLATSVDQQDFDPAPVRAAYAVCQTARHKLEIERFEMLLEVRQVLTYEQWRKIEEMKQRIKQNRDPQRRPGSRQGGQRPPGDRPPDY
jgi:Spy/CpxP family protein refolding chaperone